MMICASLHIEGGKEFLQFRPGHKFICCAESHRSRLQSWGHMQRVFYEKMKSPRCSSRLSHTRDLGRSIGCLSMERCEA